MVCIVVCLSVFFIMGVPTFAMDHRVSLQAIKLLQELFQKKMQKNINIGNMGIIKAMQKDTLHQHISTMQM